MFALMQLTAEHTSCCMGPRRSSATTDGSTNLTWPDMLLQPLKLWFLPATALKRCLLRVAVTEWGAGGCAEDEAQRCCCTAALRVLSEDTLPTSDGGCRKISHPMMLSMDK